MRIISRVGIFLAATLLATIVVTADTTSSSPAEATYESWASHVWTSHGGADGVPGDAMWKDVAYGNGTFVAVASSGSQRVMTSADGINWQPRTVPQVTWRSVAFGMVPSTTGLFVAVGEAGGDSVGHVMTSPDGVTWTVRSAPPGAWSSVVYGDGLFVAVSGSNVGGTPWVITSSNGVDWSAQTVDGDQRWSAVTHGSGLFVAVSDVPQMGDVASTHRVMTSPDGVDWTPIPSAPLSNWYAVTYGNGRFVAVSYGGSDRVMTSVNGSTWTALVDPASRTVAAGALYYSISYGDGLFVALAYGSKKVMTSSDGLIWTSTEPVAAEANVWTAIVHGDRVVVAVAESGTKRVMRFGPTVPAKPTTSGLSCSNAIASLNVSVTSDGGLPITNYEYHIATSHPGTEPTTWQPFAPTQSASPLTWDMKELGYSPGVAHYFYVRAVNAVGASPSSWVLNSSSSCANNFTVSAPGAPTALTAAAAPGSTSIAFTAGSANGSAITNYEYSTDGVNFVALNPADATSPVTIPGLIAGQTYTIYLKAVNSIGASTVSEPVTVTALGPVPTATAVSPSEGSTIGGTTITITGTNFMAGATVLIGTGACTDVVVASSTSLTCVTPVGSAGTFDVKVTNPDGQHATVTSGFTFVTAPVTPGVPDLVDASDTGSSSTDNITSDNTPTISVAGATNSHTVTVTASKDGESDVSCTFVATAASSCDLGQLADGVWSVVSFQQSSTGIASAVSAPLLVTIDTTPPTAANSSINDAGSTVTIPFPEVLGSVIAPLSDFVITVNGVVVGGAGISISGSTLVVTLATPAAPGAVVVVTYTSPSSNIATTAVQDIAGNAVSSFSLSATVAARTPQNGGSVVSTPGTSSPGPTSPAPVPPRGGAPLPVPTRGGALPQLAPGVAQVFEGGVPVEVTLTVLDQTRLALRGPDFELVLSGDCSGNDCTIQMDENGRETLVLELDGAARVSGFGFLPGSLVHVWIFSDPVYLGALTVAADGTFEGDLALLGVPVGEHTLQVNGISFDGVDRTADLGVLIAASAPQLPTSGAEVWDYLLLAVLLVLLGLLVISGRRRNSLSNSESPAFSEFWGDEDSG
jgi:hypothetical protein